MISIWKAKHMAHTIRLSASLEVDMVRCMPVSVKADAQALARSTLSSGPSERKQMIMSIIRSVRIEMPCSVKGTVARMHLRSLAALTGACDGASLSQRQLHGGKRSHGCEAVVIKGLTVTSCGDMKECGLNRHVLYPLSFLTCPVTA